MSAAEAHPTAPPRTAHTGHQVGTLTAVIYFFIRWKIVFLQKQVFGDDDPGRAPALPMSK